MLMTVSAIYSAAVDKPLAVGRDDIGHHF